MKNKDLFQMTLKEFFTSPGLTFHGEVDTCGNSERMFEFYVEDFTIISEIRFENYYWAGDPDVGIPDHTIENDNTKIEVMNITDFEGNQFEITPDDEKLLEKIIFCRIFDLPLTHEIRQHA